ncbi:DUF1080 domain-containing protein [bacterium]|nr:DUF1080 domain-containing protein [bacterium]
MHLKPRRNFGPPLAKKRIFLLTLLLTAFLSPISSGQTSSNENGTLAPVGAENRPSDASLDQGWISLFDGKTLYGWKAQTEVDWQVNEGTIKATAGKSGLLRTTAQFSDYELSVDFKATAETNSGIFLRTSPKPKSAAKDCYEVNIAPETNKFPTGGVVARSPIESPVTSDDQWHTLRMTISGDKGEVFLDGQPVNTFTSADLGRGYIGLQFRSGDIQFRNIFLKPLNLQPLLAGKTLDNWILDNARETTFTVDESEDLHMKSGPGQLESKQQFADFVLSAKIKTNAEGLNSGIFFRCIPGEKMNGYESQIQNQMIDDDPTKPFDCGTGGIFRRQNARRIVAQDKQWFYKTIVASGSHISVWVNGYQVTDWTDARKPDDNPRRGLRLAAGTIMLQGHDPTTDVLFGEISVAELLPRR